jgi:prophage regulatory protein
MAETDTFLRDADVTRVTGLPRSTRYDLIKRGQFPKPIKLSERMAAWSAAEIAAWQQSRVALRDAAKPQPRNHRRQPTT